MASQPKSDTTAEQRSAQLRAAVARREAVQTLDTFETAAAPATAAPVRVGDAVRGSGPDVNTPGFGETDTTEVTGETTIDQEQADQAEEAGDLENEALAAGEAEVDEYQKGKDDLVASLFPEEDPNFRPPAIDDPASRLPGGGGAREAAGGGGGGGDSSDTGGGGAQAISESGSGGGGADTQTSAGISGGGIPDGLPTGADLVSTATGPQADLSYLIGDPRDLVHNGGGNSAANDSDAVHDAFTAVIDEQRTATADKYSVADDQANVDKLAVAVGALIAPAVGPIPVAVYGVIRAADELSGDAISGAVDLTTVSEKSDILQDQLDDKKNQQTIQDVNDKLHGFTDDPLLTGQSQETTVSSPAMEVYAKTHGKSYVRDPGSPDEDNRRGAPPTEAEQALRAATNRLLGRNDALVHGPATQINPGDQGEVFQRGSGPAPDARAVKESMIGQPKDDGAKPAPASDPNAPPPPPGTGPDRGGDIDFEDGTGYNGPIRHEGPEDVQFGTQDPLIGLGGGPGTDDDALPPEDDDDDVKQSGKHSGLAIFDNDDD